MKKVHIFLFIDHTLRLKHCRKRLFNQLFSTLLRTNQCFYDIFTYYMRELEYLCGEYDDIIFH